MRARWSSLVRIDRWCSPRQAARSADCRTVWNPPNSSFSSSRSEAQISDCRWYSASRASGTSVLHKNAASFKRISRTWSFSNSHSQMFYLSLKQSWSLSSPKLIYFIQIQRDPNGERDALVNLDVIYLQRFSCIVRIRFIENYFQAASNFPAKHQSFSVQIDAIASWSRLDRNSISRDTFIRTIEKNGSTYL